MEASTILMCKPEYFNVDYEINPWMKGNVGKAQRIKAKTQWQNLVSTIKKYANVTFIEPQEGLPDMVFTANGALIHKNKAIIAKFEPKQRQGEEVFFKEWFEKQGFCVDVASEEPFEGAGDALFDRGKKRLWAAYGFRSSRKSHQSLAKMLDVEVLSLELVDPRFYHLDTCFCPLALGYLMYYENAFSYASQKLIEEKVPKEKLIKVSQKDAAQFALNAVNIGNTVILHKASFHLRFQLESRGFKVEEACVDEFMKAGGSTKCLTLQLNEH